MKKMYKGMLLVLCAVLLVAASVMGTLAYLKSETETITNTMTIGKVAITLDEAKVNAYGEKLTTTDTVATGAAGEVLAARVMKNDYKLVPGRAYTKDPTIHVSTDSESCWLFVKLVNPIANIEETDQNDGYATVAEQMAANGWKKLNSVDNVYYHDVVSAGTNVIVFDHFKIEDSFNGTGNYADVTVTAYAVQAEGFASAQAAWGATFGAPTNP